ncbi:HD domain-containing protein [Peptostreptococcus faecalis]|uniref:HD domain-containing protein n=1 Tax=Peptostreptococcus faecalis TaxID=2045015 RepID=UPI001FA8D8AF|nr:HD domain-containing protein [Peptostreptococcus faecalis]
MTKIERNRFEKNLYLYTEIEKLIVEHGQDILTHENMQKEKEFIQHGDVNCYDHSIFVAYMSILIVQTLKLNVNINSLIRGALLHDYFLYDWHEKSEDNKWHGFTHAQTALNSALNDFELSEIEEDIIKKHMFPLNIELPSYKESVVVTIADKLCAIADMIELYKNRNKERCTNIDLILDEN